MAAEEMNFGSHLDLELKRSSLSVQTILVKDRRIISVGFLLVADDHSGSFVEIDKYSATSWTICSLVKGQENHL